MTYTFHRCQLHAGCPGLLDWRLAIRPGDALKAARRYAPEDRIISKNC